MGPSALLLAVAAGCAGHVREAWEAERAAALAEPPPLEEGWEPDLRLVLRAEAVAEVARAAVQAALTEAAGQVGEGLPSGFQARARARVTRLELRPRSGCGGCMDVDLHLEGRLRWTAGPLSGRLPLEVGARATLAFEVERAGGAWRVRGRLVDLQRLDVPALSARSWRLDRAARRWARRALERVPPISLGTFGGSGLPLLGLRLGAQGGDLAVDARTDAPAPAPLSACPAPRGGADWTLCISEGSALSLARREAFRRGPIDPWEVALDPRTLEVEGRDFELGLRLWRLAGRGWWRDYGVHGRIALRGGQLRLDSTRAVEAGHSRGAALADPLAALAEGRILDAVADGIHEAMPARGGAEVGGIGLHARLTDAGGQRDAIVLRGALVVGSD